MAQFRHRLQIGRYLKCFERDYYNFFGIATLFNGYQLTINWPRLPRQFRRRDLQMDMMTVSPCPPSDTGDKLEKSVGNQTWPCCWLQPPRAVHTRSPLNSVEARVRAVDIGPTDAGSPLTQKISIAESGGQHYGYIAHFGIKILVIHQHYVTLLGDHCSLTFWHVLSLDSD